MILLTLETEHFFFQALEPTKEDARYNLGMALKCHADQYGLSANWYYDYEIKEAYFESGSAYRDGQLLYRRP